MVFVFLVHPTQPLASPLFSYSCPYCANTLTPPPPTTHNVPPHPTPLPERKGNSSIDQITQTCADSSNLCCSFPGLSAQRTQNGRHRVSGSRDVIVESRVPGGGAAVRVGAEPPAPQRRRVQGEQHVRAEDRSATGERRRAPHAYLTPRTHTRTTTRRRIRRFCCNTWGTLQSHFACDRLISHVIKKPKGKKTWEHASHFATSQKEDMEFCGPTFMGDGEEHYTSGSPEKLSKYCFRNMRRPWKLLHGKLISYVKNGDFT